jgi:hypothetical protein
MTDTTNPPEPVCKFDQGCHRVAACEPGCAAVPVPASAPTDRAAIRDRIAEALRPGSRDRSGQYPEGLLRDADMVLAVLPAPADRAAILREAADAIDAETQQLKDHGVLEPDKFRPCRDASAQLRHMADEEQQPEPAPPIDRCIHVREIHRTHHKLAPVTGCPWCTAATSTEA